MTDELLVQTEATGTVDLQRRIKLVREAVTLKVVHRVLTTLLNQPRNELRLRERGFYKQATPCEERGQRMVYQALPGDEDLPQLFELFQSAVEDASGKLKSIFLPPEAESSDPRALKQELRDLVKAGNALCDLDWDEHQWLDYGFVQRFLRGCPFTD